MRPGRALGLALHDFYKNSWRLLPVNAAAGMILLAAGVTAIAVRAALVAALLAGPFLAALAHCAVTLRRTGNLAWADVRDGLRLHWHRGLLLTAAGGALLLLGVVAVHVYAQSGVWPLAFVTLYLLALLGVYQLVLWTLAIAEPGLPLPRAARDAARFVALRPWPTLALGLTLLAINVAGIAAALMPFLTLTIAYSFLAAANFVLED
jgi:energy-converting hydrogenase Eha subunit A